MDSWQLLHTVNHDYSYFSTVHQRYSRLDYILLAQEFLPMHISADKTMAGWSDHAPISTYLKSPLFRPRGYQWKLNESILAEIPMVADLRTVITTYFEENDTLDTPPLTTWEAHKCVVRGHLIKVCTQRKRDQKRHMEELTHKIEELEDTHKTSQTDDTYRALLEARQALRELLSQKLQHTIRKSKCFFYEYSNKCWRLLARALQRQRGMSHITKFKPKEGPATHLQDKMTAEFHKYYMDLYNLRCQESPEEERQRSARMTAYLQQHVSKTLNEVKAAELEAPITGTAGGPEVHQAE
ncbi:Hypothetical predicted protein [Pelobates cultripes]|uniref:Endonuclease/exonuclease/phosphatase domain-containing protein n=1 Tax=Pelobates cultripes TaxID=61616 RepID=A0AAD1S5D1_PELCU|nr:Hypothetical predicted protein [Pelobates cultripes]